MKLFKKNSKQQINESILQHKYAVYFSSSRLFKGITLTILGWLLAGCSTLASQHLVLKNSIFVTLFIIFTSAFVPMFICALIKGKAYFICGRPKYVVIRSVIAVVNFYSYYMCRFWISKTTKVFLFSLDTLFVPILIFVMFRKKLSLLTWGGIIAGLVGLSIIYPVDLNINSLQDILEISVSLGSAFFMAWLIIISCYIIRHDPPVRQTLYTTFAGMFFSSIGILCTGWETPCSSDLIQMIIQGFLYSTVVLIYLNGCDCIEPHVFVILSHSLSLFIIYVNSLIYTVPIFGYIHAGALMTLAGVIVVIAATRFHMKEEDMLLAQ